MSDIPINLPDDLVREIGEVAGDSQLEKFIEDAVRAEVRERAKIRKRIEQSLETPLKQGPPDWDKLRKEHRNVPVNLPGYLVDGVDELVGKRGRSHFIVYLVLKGLEEAAEELSKGEEEFDAIINPVTNPEWATSAMVYAWVRASRDLDNERLMEKWGGEIPA